MSGRLRIVSFALGLALSATGAWAQPDCSMEYWKRAWPGCAQNAPVAPGTVTLSGDVEMGAVTLPDGIQLSGGNFELSPDQKLARAYALCGHKDGKVQMLMCARIEAKVEDTPTTDADRVFIEEVARSLK